MITAIILVICLLIVLEMISRFYIFRHRPLRISIAYSFFMLSTSMIEENYALAQRIIRGGFSSEEELFKYYEKISGRPYIEIKKKYGCNENWRSIFNRKYSSGGHGIIEQNQRMHLGLMPKPNQILQTMNIDNTGRRMTGYDFENNHISENGKTCLFLGGSLLFGAGATGDNETIPGRVGFYLNNETNGNPVFYMVNLGMLGFNSLQEVISLMQSEIKPDYVVALSGWNEIDQAINSQSKVASLAQACDARANTSNVKNLVNIFLRRFIAYGIFKRFIFALMTYDDIPVEEMDTGNINIYPLF